MAVGEVTKVSDVPAPTKGSAQDHKPQETVIGNTVPTSNNSQLLDLLHQVQQDFGGMEEVPIDSLFADVDLSSGADLIFQKIKDSIPLSLYLNEEALTDFFDLFEQEFRKAVEDPFSKCLARTLDEQKSLARLKSLIERKDNLRGAEPDELNQIASYWLSKGQIMKSFPSGEDEFRARFPGVNKEVLSQVLSSDDLLGLYKAVLSESIEFKQIGGLASQHLSQVQNAPSWIQGGHKAITAIAASLGLAAAIFGGSFEGEPAATVGDKAALTVSAGGTEPKDYRREPGTLEINKPFLAPKSHSLFSPKEPEPSKCIPLKSVDFDKERWAPFTVVFKNIQGLKNSVTMPKVLYDAIQCDGEEKNNLAQWLLNAAIGRTSDPQKTLNVLCEKSEKGLFQVFLAKDDSPPSLDEINGLVKLTLPKALGGKPDTNWIKVHNLATRLVTESLQELLPKE